MEKIETANNVKSRVITHLPKNPVNRLQYRELGGLHRHHRLLVRSQIFHKLPGRLAFSLSSLVSQSVLEEGHVFLGFTRNGQYILSYTLQLEANTHTPYPFYGYKLQCWQFVPYRRLRLVTEIRLFGEEEIQQDLFLTVCEWPSMADKLVIHGYSVGRLTDGDEKRHCYVTVTALPPVGPCSNCSQASANTDGYVTTPRCLQHSYTVHTHYEVAPPYPPFLPHVSLACDGIAVFNTGDSLIAVNVRVDDGHGNHCTSFPLAGDVYSPSHPSSIASIDDIGYVDDDAAASGNETVLPSAESVLPATPSPCSSSYGQLRGCVDPQPTTPKDATNMSVVEPRLVRERHLSCGKENQLKLMCAGSPAASCGGCVSHDASCSRPSLLSRCMDVYNFDSTLSKNGDDSNDVCDNLLPIRSLSCVKTSRTVTCGTGLRRCARLLASEIQETPVDERTESLTNVVEFPGPLPRLTIVPPRLLEGAGLYSWGWGMSPGRATSSTCSSCLSSPVFLQSDTQCFTFSVRRYAPVVAHQGGAAALPDVEDDGNLAYHSILPMEVHGTVYSNLRLVTKQTAVPHTPSVIIQQLTLDVEHYLGEAVKSSAEWGHRYLAFTDYDVQIVEVCADTAEVSAIVFVLIRARPAEETHQRHGTRSIPKLYQTVFKLVWNLQTGSYKTLDVEDLIEVNQSQLMRKQWHPGHKICDALYRRFAVPPAHHQMAHVHTNEAVFRGQSLKMLLDRQHYVAILL